jgi:hypothetical protein
MAKLIRPTAGLGKTPMRVVVPWRPREMVYGPLVEGVLARFPALARVTAQDLARAPMLAGELLRQPPERRWLMVRNSLRYRGLGLCQRLLEASEEASRTDPGAGEALGLLALGVVELSEPSAAGACLIADAKARCWSAVANARRLAADLPAAELACQLAERHLGEGLQDPLVCARFLSVKAALRRAQQLLPEAAALLRRAAALYHSSGEHHLANELLGLFDPPQP